jgi:perosamine synthetase
MINFAQPHISSEEIKEVLKVLKSKWLTTGGKNVEFATAIKKYTNTKYCLPVNSCTSAIHLALICAEVQSGDEIITTPLTFVSTINTIVNMHASPVFVDIKPNDFIIDEDRIEEKITKKTKAIVITHYAGYSANLTKLRKITKRHKIALIEDAAHAFGSKYNNEYIGENSDYACFSFYPTKNITSAEGGGLVTNKKSIYERALILSSNGITKHASTRYLKEGSWRYDVTEAGFKYNLSDLHAALGLAQLKQVKKFQKHRELLFSFYKNHLTAIPQVTLLTGNSYSDPFRHMCVIKTTSTKISRDEIIQKLKEKNIICSVHFIPVYKFSYYKYLKIKTRDYPQTEKAFSQCISLPFSSTTTLKDATIVVRELKKLT